MEAELLQLLELSFNKNASDLHLSPGLPPMMRINGDLAAIQDFAPLEAEKLKNLIYLKLLIYILFSILLTLLN